MYYVIMYVLYIIHIRLPLILFTSFFSIWVSPSNFNLLDQPIQNVVYCYIKYNVSSREAKLSW